MESSDPLKSSGMPQNPQGPLLYDDLMIRKDSYDAEKMLYRMNERDVIQKLSANSQFNFLSPKLLSFVIFIMLNLFSIS